MKLSLIAAVAGLTLVSFEAGGQIAPNSVHFGVAAGASIPQGDLSKIVQTGFDGTVILAFQPTMIPVGVRIDGAYNQMGAKGGGGNAHYTSVTGNFVYKFPSTSVSPYVIGGAGLYNVAVSATGFPTISENHFGWNAGGGISMPLSGFDTFIEARFNQVKVNGSNQNFIPITFGVMF